MHNLHDSTKNALVSNHHKKIKNTLIFNQSTLIFNQSALILHQNTLIFCVFRQISVHELALHCLRRVSHSPHLRAHLSKTNSIMGFVRFFVSRRPYGVATISRLLQIIGLFCKRALLKRLYFAKETYDFKEPTNRSHPISACANWKTHINNEHILILCVSQAISACTNSLYTASDAVVSINKVCVCILMCMFWCVSAF